MHILKKFQSAINRNTSLQLGYKAMKEWKKIIFFLKKILYYNFFTADCIMKKKKNCFENSFHYKSQFLKGVHINNLILSISCEDQHKSWHSDTLNKMLHHS